jgi:hypothetical protein
MTSSSFAIVVGLCGAAWALFDLARLLHRAIAHNRPQAVSARRLAADGTALVLCLAVALWGLSQR